MSALHEALKSLNPISYSDVPLGDLEPFLSSAFSNGQLIVDSVPAPHLSSNSTLPERRGQSSASSSSASSASEMSTSFTHSPLTPTNMQALQKEWKSVKLNQKDNPLSINVFKLGAKDGNGTWFARRSIHEGLDFEKWRRGLESEFHETLKVRGGPGEGNIRGIGGERRVEYQRIRGAGKLEVYLLSAQFPGPTAPRDFVTMNLTSDQLRLDQPSEEEGLRHFMLISRPCLHEDTAPRDGYVRGQYESVEYIREVPRKKPRLQSASTSDLNSVTRSGRNSTQGNAILNNATNNNSLGIGDIDDSNDARAVSDTDNSPSEGRARGKTISFDSPKGTNGEERDNSNIGSKLDSNPVEWIMITRSDPGGSVPRFMVERGTPGGIVSDASKFLDWACSKNIEDFDSNEGIRTEHEQEKNAEGQIPPIENEAHLRNTQLEEKGTESAAPGTPKLITNNSSDLPVMATGGINGSIFSHTPTGVLSQTPEFSSKERNINNNDSSLRRSNSSISSVSSDDSFASAVEVRRDEMGNNAASTELTEVRGGIAPDSPEFKQLKKLEKKKKNLDEKLLKAKKKDISKKSNDSVKDEEFLRKAEEKHRKEVERLERKKEKSLRKAEEKKRKADEKDEKARILRELEEARAEVGLLKKDKENLRIQVIELQAANKSMATTSGG